MDNYFKLLNTAPAAVIDLEQLADQYKQSASTAHPDSGGSETEFDLLNIAYKALCRPSMRIKHLLDIEAISYEKRGSVSNHLMNFFMSTGDLIQRADVVIKKKQQASSALTKALLENESVEMQEALSAQIELLQAAQAETLTELTPQVIAEPYEVAARDLTFLENWEAQLKERYASLF